MFKRGWIVFLFVLVINITTIHIIIEEVETSDTLFEWSHIYGGKNFDRLVSFIQTADKGYALFGETDSFGAGKDNCWLVKTDVNGNMQWNHTYGGEEMDYGGSVIQTLDGGYVFIGTTYSFGTGLSNCWLVKTNVNGTMQWNHTYGNKFTWNYGKFVFNIDENEYILAGEQFSKVDTHLWLMRVSCNGSISWNHSYIVKNQRIDIHSTLRTPNGGFLILGSVLSNILLIKTDSNGIMQWNQTIGDNSTDACAYSVIQTTDGGYALAGETGVIGYRSVMWLIKTDSTGNVLWNQTYKGINDDQGVTLFQKADEGFIIAGNTDSYGAGGTDIWVVETDVKGEKIREQTFGGKEGDRVIAILPKNDGGFIIAGITNEGWSDSDIWMFSTKPQWWINKPWGISGFEFFFGFSGVIVLILLMRKKKS
jgi:hypothetical protein